MHLQPLPEPAAQIFFHGALHDFVHRKVDSFWMLAVQQGGGYPDLVRNFNVSLARMILLG